MSALKPAIAAVVAGLVMLGLGQAAVNNPGSGGAFGALVRGEGTRTHSKPSTPAKKTRKKTPAGVVIAHSAGSLTVLPFEAADPYTRKATASQKRACPEKSRYPDCLQ